ncbi:MAG: EAL domain-containing protein [Atopobiaceae bacterium]|nr:EAL domain-containing protein [Atopobiaceae bacterium]
MVQAENKATRSIFSTILIPIIVLILAEVLIFAAVLLANNVIGRINQNDNDIFDNQVDTRKNYLEDYFVGSVSNLDQLADVINNSAAELIESNQLDLSDLDGNITSTSRLQQYIIGPMISTLRDKAVSGIFVIFNTDNLEDLSGTSLKMPGILIKDTDPAATPSARNEDLAIEHSSIELLNTLRIRTDVGWSPLFNFQGRARDKNFDFIRIPFQAALTRSHDASASDFAYWSTTSLLEDDVTDGQALCYTIPLILDDGTVYGVVGVSLATKYLQSLMPMRDFINGQEGAYALVSFSDDQTTDVIELTPSVVNATGSFTERLGNTITLETSHYGGYTVKDAPVGLHAGFRPFKLYNTHAPFEHDRWGIIGVIPETILHSFSRQLQWTLVITALVMAVAGIVGAVLVGHSISKPIRKLSNEVYDAHENHRGMPQLSKTNIAEIDQFTTAIATLSEDIDKVREAEQSRIEHERDYDMLTGLMNRRSFYREASVVFSQPEELKQAALVMLDLDNLKKINDMYGHDWGDKYIYQAANTFKKLAPSNALVARVSGDEFYILFHGHDSQQEIETSIEKLKTSIPQTEFALPGGKIEHINASGGVALYLKDAEEFEELMRLADFTMYQVKMSGKNNIAYFDIDNYRQRSNELRAKASFNDLMDNCQLASYHFQPIFDAQSGRPFAYEALLRVALDALQSPADVFSIARKESRLREVERMTWIRTLESYQGLLSQNEVDKAALLFINSIASVSLDMSEFERIAERFSNLLSHLVIEITETENMDEEATAIKRKVPGFTGLFALDDYGSGYNSELKLLELKPSFVKVDISIVRDINSSVDKQRIVTNIVEYAHERNMKIIAEGIETPSELACLLDLNVDLLQGYYLARPSEVPAAINPVALKQIQEHKATP